ncbi:MAG: helix-turn-helix domain-containing protein [Pseudomonadota bacterium]
MLRQVILPGPELAPYIRNFMVSGFSSLENHLPAVASSQLVFYFNGGASLLGGSAGSGIVPQAFIAGPTLAPRTFRVQPGSEFVGIMFRPSGLQACLGLPAHICNGQIVPLEHFLPKPDVEQILEQLAGRQSASDRVGLIEKFLLRAMLKASSKIVTLPALSMAQLLQPAKNLAQTFSLSTRQLERRFLVSYGMPLRDYRRLSRFSLALAQLMFEPPRAGGLTRVAQDSHYVDQSHFIRDFRQFIGDTPLNLLKAFDGEESIYRLWRLTRRELDMYAD